MDRPLNFLHLTTFYPPYSFGGDAMQIYRLAHALANRGHHVDVVHCTDAFHLLHPAEPSLAYATHPNVVRHELRSPWGALSPILTQQTGQPWMKNKAIADVLALRAYDVIHYHNISLLGPGVLALLPPGSQPIKVYTTHEHWLICPMHVLWKFDGEPCQEPECARCCLLSKRPPQLWRYTGLLERMTGHVDRFFSPSRFTVKMHAERGFSAPLAHLPNFIDPVDEDWRSPAPRPQQASYFLFVGRLEAVKGLQTLIPLWKSLQYDLLIAGSGTQEPALRALAAGNPRIRFLGPCTQHELGALYFHALACVIPSVTYESFGLTAIEAFARKTPVIARDLGGLTEVVDDSGGGFLYRTDAELTEALRQIADSPKLRGELGAKGYDAFRRWWTTDAHLKLYFEYLNAVALRKFGQIPWSESSQ